VAGEAKLLGQRRDITWKQLAALPVVTVRSGYGVRGRIDKAMAEAGVQLRIEHEVSLLTTALALASAGLGVAVVPSTVMSAVTHPTLVTRALVRPRVERNTAFIYKKERGLSPAAGAFLKMITEEFGAL
jgi:LysR family carnitine catabolism transcriptional activator